MKRILILWPLALLATVPHAQQSRNRVGFVKVETAIKAVPGSKTYLDLQAKVAADLKAKQSSLQALSTKAANTRSAADRQALTKAQQAYTSARTSYAQRLNTEFQPLAAKLNGVVAKVAKANGYSVVMDHTVAVSSRVAVYINDPATDLTNAVIKELK